MAQLVWAISGDMTTLMTLVAQLLVALLLRTFSVQAGQFGIFRSEDRTYREMTEFATVVTFLLTTAALDAIPSQILAAFLSQSGSLTGCNGQHLHNSEQL